MNERIIIPILLILCSPFQAVALSENIDNTSSSFMDEDMKTLQESSRNIRGLLEKRSHQSFINRTESVPEKKELQAFTGIGQCLQISGVYLKGITLLSLKDLTTLSAIPTTCITSNNINKLTSEIENIYIKKGYVTARLQFVPPSHDRRLGINVIEGFIEGIEGGTRWTNSQTLFPHLTNKPLNLNQLDQGLDQANRLQSNKTTIDILPGTKKGGSIIKLHNQHSSPWKVVVKTDNYGQKSTGEWVGRLNTSFDSPLGLSDFISFSGSNTLDKHNTKYSRSYVLLYSIPYGDATISGFSGYSEYTRNADLRMSSVNFHGNSQQSGVRSDWVFYRDQMQIDTLSTQLTYKNSNNYIEGSKIAINSPTLSVFTLGISHLKITPGRLIILDANIEKGMRWFGAQTAAPFQDKTFIKGSLSAKLQQHFALFNLPFQFNTQFYAQYSPNSLPGIEWLNISDNSALRGFSKNSVSADNGWYLRNTLSHSIPIPKGSVTLNIGADIGQVLGYKSKVGWQSSAGLSTGITLNYQNLCADVELSQGKILSHQNKNAGELIQLLTRFSFRF
ncbi:ShlB/FhaC/HecB family hemolysin secretion/activation protein [Xenorhabdus bovienii]|uniref:ShlB/FhaC/HecB family hemolysin secretion/activation protein n=1 Tax=Xenorhabdus bovienii TaxID=40576 RepID=UPI003DA50BD5